MKNSQAFRIGQNSFKRKDKNDYYKWEIWIENADLSLDAIEKVEYLLHPTFPNRLRTSTDRAEKFKIKSSGWGEFMIKILIYTKTGQEFNFTHWLILSDKYSNNEETFKKAKKPISVFISFANADARLAQDIEHRLTDLGLEVKTASIMKPGSAIKNSIEEAIRGSDAVLAIQPQYEDHWVKVELDIAEQASVKIVPLIKHRREISKNLERLNQFRITDFLDVENDKIMSNIINSLKKSST